MFGVSVIFDTKITQYHELEITNQSTNMRHLLRHFRSLSLLSENKICIFAHFSN